MTALYVPEGIPPPALIGALAERGIVIAGGLHKDIKVRSRAPRGCEESGGTVLTRFISCCCFDLCVPRRSTFGKLSFSGPPLSIRFTC